MRQMQGSIIRLWNWWFTPRSNDPAIIYRERALRVLLPIVLILRGLATFFLKYPDLSGKEVSFPPVWVGALLYILFMGLSFFFLEKNRIGATAICFLAYWFITDLFNLIAQGLWYPGLQISLIIEVILGALLLSRNMIIPFTIFQLTIIGTLSAWLYKYYYQIPVLSTGKPIIDFQSIMITLVFQEAFITIMVRYLRLEMEKNLVLQQSTIMELKDEIQQRHLLEKEREKYIEELNKKNAELERFTYSVSHDLKSPLVTIKGFLGILNRDMLANNSSRIQNDIQRIGNAADKMQILLGNLLELSRIGRIINPSVEINTQQLIQETLELLDGRIRPTGVNIVVANNLPAIYGDHIRLREVFENLIENAIKFVGKQTAPTIEVGSRDEAGQTIFFVRDNGIGIEPQYLNRVFSLFEKLNPKSAGTGIGLAMVKRIIEEHGGKIWAESDGLGKGATFCFTIPDNRKTDEKIY